MTRSHARLRGLTLEQRVWRCLRRSPGLSPRALAAAMGIGVYSASNTLRRMRLNGSAVTQGRTTAILYFATAREPDDWRGAAPGSLRALQEHAPRRTRKERPRVKRPKDALSREWVGT